MHKNSTVYQFTDNLWTTRYDNNNGAVAPGYLIDNVVDSEPGCTGLESRYSRYIALLKIYAVT